MLRKRNRSVQKDQYKGHLMPDSASESDGIGKSQKNGSFFSSVPRLFVGFSLKGVSDSDSAWSPTSPLDYKLFPSLGNPFRSPRSSAPNGTHKSWNCGKVGLGIVDSLDDANKSSGNVVGLSESRNVLFGSQLRIPSSKSFLSRSIDSSLAAKSLPKNYAISPHPQPNSPLGNTETSMGNGEMQLEPKPFGRFRSCLSDCGRPMSPLSGLTYDNLNLSSEDFWSENNTSNAGFSSIGGAPSIDNSLSVIPSLIPLPIGPDHGIVASLSASEIEQSEDYTCVISHGPNPKTTHIFGDCILECHTNELGNFGKKEEREIASVEAAQCSNSSLPLRADDFFIFCHFCKKQFEEGRDIYMYRGEKAFCSCSCRDQQILIDEESEKHVNKSSCDSPKSTCSDDFFTTDIVVKT